MFQNHLRRLLFIVLLLIGTLGASGQAQATDYTTLLVRPGSNEVTKYFWGYSNVKKLSSIECPTALVFENAVLVEAGKRKILKSVPFRWRPYGDLYRIEQSTSPFEPKKKKYGATCELVARIPNSGLADRDVAIYFMYGPNDPYPYPVIPNGKRVQVAFVS